MTKWNVEYTDEFEAWWNTLSARAQSAVGATVEMLIREGPQLDRPHADTLYGSKITNLKELRSRDGRSHFRTLFAFDPRRTAILLIAGDKAGDDRFYERMIPLAEQLYEAYLNDLKREGEI
ncbi:type II toxin-antitoxin system RelE/ParE family toxin [Rhodopirellula baltica]|uniref:Addiction module toxin RelE n=1 Tax=Rhodopirellula baltica SWK14 TaxID=993516 RepID=L7CL21_RHOBT|nr:type II toxin-antitoxin system RelE/ParE family toxin [Rhodopirellula baltica]ELP34530.1 hypothetical protein RBSWK_01540 [Rhodopirellula baltica SWK14]